MYLSESRKHSAAFNTDLNYNTFNMKLSVWKHHIQFTIKYTISIISAF